MTATATTTATTAAAAESSGCALEVWDRSRFQGERDWMVLADGESIDDARNWLRWDGAEGAGHLYSISTHGYVNFRPPDFVRGHGDHGGKGAKGAPQGPGTLVQLQGVDGSDASAAAAEALAADAGEGGAPPLGARAANDKTRCAGAGGAVRLKFVRSGRYAHVDEAGRLQAKRTSCAAADVDCTFDRLRVPSQPGRFALRSRLTGHFVRVVDNSHPGRGVVSAYGAREPRARPKRWRALAPERAAAATCACPLRRPTGAPAGWSYNCSDYVPLLRKAFAPWHEGNVSATALDFAFDHAMFGATARREGKPASQHVSVVNGVLLMASNNDYRRDLLQDMLKTTQSLVPLPDVEFLANLWDHPKVPQQNVEAVFAMYVDDAHNDIPVPSAHAWDVERHAYPQPHTELKGSGGGNCPPFSQRKPRLFFRGGGCTGPTEAYRAWSWRFYNRKRIARLSHAHPDLLDAGILDWCGSRKVSKLEFPWDKQMVEEMRREAPTVGRVPWAKACHYRYVLNLDGNAAASRLASLFHSGSAVFLPDSPFYEWFYPLLRPWVHYVPVGRQLDDVLDRVRWANAHPDEVAAIARRGAAFAKQHLHTHTVACYWWQLLTEWAAMQSFHARATIGTRFN